ncbi:ankyrin repeat-containing domain, PGG domain protein [Tanacetum coccineum]
MHTETSCCFLNHVNTRRENNTLFAGANGDKHLVLAISSQEFGLAHELQKNYCHPVDSEAVLMAIAQNFPLLNFWESITEEMQGHLPDVFRCVVTKLQKYGHISILLSPSLLHQSIFEAVRQDAIEVVKEILYKFPDAVWSANEDGHNIIQYAVINRSENIYNILPGMREHKNIYKTIEDSLGNNLLHLAARLAPATKLNLISGGALQLQYELQWYKVRISINSNLNIAQNTKSAVTVPGGNNQDTWVPFVTNNPALTVFAISDTISLFTALTSLIEFLSIPTEHFTEQDFLYKLPRKLLSGLATLFISMTAMNIAFGATLFVVFGQKNYSTLIPIAALITCLPVTSFVTLQFPLVANLTSATYGRSIFGRKLIGVTVDLSMCNVHSRGYIIGHSI